MERERKPFDEIHYENRAEEAIDWYRHYMSIELQDLADEYDSCKHHENRTVTVPMEQAVEVRIRNNDS